MGGVDFYIPPQIYDDAPPEIATDLKPPLPALPALPLLYEKIPGPSTLGGKQGITEGKAVGAIW